MVSGLEATLQVARGDFVLDVELAVQPGEVVALLGPNGAGKSTVLRSLAGLLPLDDGRITIGDVVVEHTERRRRLAAHERSAGVVFQDYLLFPHLTVLDNVAFGPRARGESKQAARAIATELLERMGLSALAGQRPRQVSGGQAQRVALARALATGPELLLLDEPLSALDARTRLEIRSELRRRLRGFAGATLVVTHDPVDAAVLADRVIVIEDGRVVQVGTPTEVAQHPRTDYVARLVGLNLLAGQADGHVVSLGGGGTVQVAESADGPVLVSFRPSAVALFLSRPHGSPRNVWQGTVDGMEPHGEGVRVAITGAPGPTQSVLAELTPAAIAELDLAPGSPVWVAVKASEVRVYPDAPSSEGLSR